jgi:hypothetical protein
MARIASLLWCSYVNLCGRAFISGGSFSRALLQVTRHRVEQGVLGGNDSCFKEEAGKIDHC